MMKGRVKEDHILAEPAALFHAPQTTGMQVQSLHPIPLYAAIPARAALRHRSVFSVAPADFAYENMQIQCNVIKSAHDTAVKKLLFLGSTCIYPKLAPQPIPECALLTGPLEETNEAYAIAKISGVGVDTAYLRRRKHYDIRLFRFKKRAHLRLISQIQLFVAPPYDVPISFFLQIPDNGAPHQSTVPRHIYFICFLLCAGDGRNPYGAGICERSFLQSGHRDSF